MSVFKCKMCGGTIELIQGSSVGACAFCKAKQALPLLNDDKNTNPSTSDERLHRSSASAAQLLERAFSLLEEGKWQDADSCCEEVLGLDPKSAEAYLGKLMAELRVKKRKELADLPEPFDDRGNCIKVFRFCDETLEAEMNGYISHINERNESKRFGGIYENVLCSLRNAQSEAAYKSAADIFKSMPGFRDADALAAQCLEKAENYRREEAYTSAKFKMSGEKACTYEEAIRLFQTIPGFKDSDELITACKIRIKEIKIKEEADNREARRRAEEKRIAEEKTAKKRKTIIAVCVPAASVCIALVIVLITVIIPACNYNEALSQLNDGNIVEAYEGLVALNGYRDSETKASEIFEQYKIEKMNVAEIGDTVYFGTYEQDNLTANGTEDIEWRVLAKEDGKILVISEYVLDCQQFNPDYTEITWENCTLRKWMNETFINNAFTPEEQERIESTTVSADKNPRYGTDPGNDTTDKVFLLSIMEVETYFASDEERKCIATEYALTHGVYTSVSYTKDSTYTCWWWLRTPGGTHGHSAGVNHGGAISYYGDDVNYYIDCVRPAMWIRLGS